MRDRSVEEIERPSQFNDLPSVYFERQSVLANRPDGHSIAVTESAFVVFGYRRRKINVSRVFAGQMEGVRQMSELIWLVTFMNYDLGYVDDETWRLEPIENPFGPKVLPMSPE